MTRISFPTGVPGFRDQREFDLIKKRDDSVFMWLRSPDGSVRLPVVVPWAFHWDYEINLSEADLDRISLDARIEDLLILCVVKVGDDMRRGTINLFAPILINEAKLIGVQAINKGGDYSTRDNLLGPNDPIPVSMEGLELASCSEAVLGE